MNKTNILFSGTTGRLGTLIRDEIGADSSLTQHFNIIPIYRTTEMAEFLRLATQPGTLYLDVSLADGAKSRIQALLEKKQTLPTIIGCTGFSDEDMKLLLDYSEKAPLLMAPNFSVGMTLLVSILDRYSSLLNELEAEFAIEETHHSQKKDAPSGSAKALKAALHADTPILSHRQGEVIGEHEVRAHLEHETLKFTHLALDRRVFARGALRAIRWIETNKSAGLYSMKNVLAIS